MTRTTTPVTLSPPLMVPAALPADLDLRLVSRRPARLPEATLRVARDLPVPLAGTLLSGPPTATVIVVTYNNLAFTKLCLTSVLANTGGLAYELILVDNASTDGTVDYLRAVANANPHVRLIANETNRGFAPANNQALAIAEGEVLVLLNNDTIVPPGWLRRLTRHLSDATVGAIGPVTNRIGNEAEVETGYSTVDQYLEAAEDRAQKFDRQQFDLPRPAMFCLVMRRAVYEKIGPLDEQYEIGFFEDDDYAMRVRLAGHRTVGAEDVLIHHFGEASFGKLFDSGRHGEVFRTNRGRFEAKWGIAWKPSERRPDESRAEMLDHLRRVVSTHTPRGAVIAVICKGDEGLVRSVCNEGRRGCQFPPGEDGSYAGHHPANDEEAIAGLDAVRAFNAGYLLIPTSANWWLERYPRWSDQLCQEGGFVWRDVHCSLFAIAAGHDLNDKTTKALP